MSGNRLTLRAERDLAAIADYSLQQWGKLHTRAYLADLLDRLDRLAANAMLGRSRDDIRPGTRSFLQGSHVIF